MQKTADEIKNGLVFCADKDCMNCPYRKAEWSCRLERNNDALALIQQLEADNANQREAIRVLELSLQAINATNIEQEHKIWQLEAERDAAVRDCGCSPCQTCEERENGDLCPMCEINGGYRSFHQWRGVQKEEPPC